MRDWERRLKTVEAVLVFASCLAATACGGIASSTPDAGPSTPYVGFVRATEGELGAGFARTGTVSLAPSTSVASLCASPLTVSGDCCYSPHVLEPPTLSAVGAGTLTVSDGNAMIARMMPDSTFQYSGAAMPPWNPGDILQVAASGDVVHPFAVSVQTPTAFVATPGTTSGVLIDRSKDFVTTWTPDTHSGEIVALYLVVTPGSEIINCQASDDAGQITIPVSLLANAPAGASVITNVYRSVNTTVTGDKPAALL